MEKTLHEKEKIWVTSIFSFSRYVVERPLTLSLKLWRKGLRQIQLLFFFPQEYWRVTRTKSEVTCCHKRAQWAAGAGGEGGHRLQVWLKNYFSPDYFCQTLLRWARHSCYNNSLLFTKQQNFKLVNIESICRQYDKCDQKIEICVWKGRKHWGKRRKCWLPAFSPFPTVFSKAFFSRGVKSRDCKVMGSVYVRSSLHACVRLSEFVWTMTSTIVDGFQNNLTHLFSI